MSTPETRIIISGDKAFEKAGALQKYLESARGSIEAALPAHLKPDRMMRLAITEFSKSEKIRRCTGISILQSIVIASQLGLEIGIAGQGFLVPYGTTCQFVPGWQGLVSLLNNTGRATAWTGAAYEGDKFTYSIGSAPHIDHEPGDNYGDADAITHFYACGKVNGAEIPVIEVWTKKRVEKHRDKNNKQGNAHYSFKHFEMYGRKVVLLQVLKYMPRSIEMNNALTVADANDTNRIAKMDKDIVLLEDAPEPAAQNEPEPVIEPAAQQNAAPKSQAPATTLDASSDDGKLGDTALMPTLNRLIADAGIGLAEFNEWAVRENLLRAGQNITHLSLPRLRLIVEGWADNQDKIVRARSATP